MSRSAGGGGTAAGPAPRTAGEPPVGPGRTGRRLAVVAAVAVAVGLYVAYLSPVSAWHAAFDLKVYRGAVLWWLDHRPLYAFHRNHTPYGFTYPPFAALAMLPLAAVSQTAAMVLDEVLTGLLIVLTTAWVVGPVAERRGWPRWFAVAVAVPLVYAMEPVRETAGYGQVNLVLVALVLGDLRAIGRGRRWGGLGIGIATAVKLTPGLFVVYLVLTGRWRRAAVAAGTAAAATLLALAVAPGTSMQFWTRVVFETDRVGKLWYASNQSVLGVLARVAAPGQPSPAVWLALSAAVLGGGLWRARRAYRRGDELAGVTLTGLVACLVSPISWTHHLYWVVPAAVVLLDVAGGAPVQLRGRWRPRPAAVLAGAGGAVVVGVFVLSILFHVSDRGGRTYAGGAALFPVVNGYALVMLALVAALPARALPARTPSTRTPSARPRSARPRSARVRPAAPAQGAFGGTVRSAKDRAASTWRIVSSTTREP